MPGDHLYAHFYDERDKGLMMEELRLLMRQIRVNNNNRKLLGV